MDGNGFPEAAEDGPSGDPPVSRDRQCLAGVVILNRPGFDGGSLGWISHATSA